ncbi:hypothetical protein NDU88_007673, partial [Pleurodeles waltl]
MYHLPSESGPDWRAPELVACAPRLEPGTEVRRRSERDLGPRRPEWQRNERKPGGSGRLAWRLGRTSDEYGGFDSPTDPKCIWSGQPLGEWSCGVTGSAPGCLRIGAGGAWAEWGWARPDPWEYLPQIAGRTEILEGSASAGK